MYKLNTAPTSEPISTADAKTHLRITHSDLDDYIDSLVKIARFQFEQDCPSIQLLPATWELYLDDWPSWNSYHGANIILHKRPVISISNIAYIADGGSTYTTLGTSYYDADIISYPGRINLTVSANTLPDLEEDKYNNVKVTFVAGYANAAAIPSDIIGALKLLLGHFYENPQQVMTGTQVNELPFGYKQIVNNYIRNWL